MLGIAPKPLNTIDMIPPHGNATTLANHHVVAPDTQRSVGMPVIREVKTAGPGIDPYQLHHFFTVSPRYWKNLHLTIPFQNTEHNHLATRSPAALALPTASKHRFIQFQITIKGLHTLLVQGHDHSTAAVKPIQGRTTGNLVKTEPIHRNAQAEIIQDLTHRGFADAETLPDGSACVPATTMTTPPSAGPTPMKTTFRTRSFHQPNLPFQVRSGLQLPKFNTPWLSHPIALIHSFADGGVISKRYFYLTGLSVKNPNFKRSPKHRGRLNI